MAYGGVTMSMRCPLCKSVFEKVGPESKCPNCHRTLLVPNSLRAPHDLEYRRARKRVLRRREEKSEEGPHVLQIFGFLSERRSVRSFLFAILVVGTVVAVALLGRRGEPVRPRTINAVLDASEELDVLRIALELQYRDTGHYPDTQEGLLPLLSPGTNDMKSGWAGPYITKLHGDPWRRPYVYRLGTNGVPFLFSLGADGVPGTKDDLFPRPLAELQIPTK